MVEVLDYLKTANQLIFLIKFMELINIMKDTRYKKNKRKSKQNRLKFKSKYNEDG